MARSTGTLPPRAVVVTRPSDYETLLVRHGTREQARFFLETRGRHIEEELERHAVQERALHHALAAIPREWRRARVARGDLDRFLFEPEDLIIAVGQDGLVANVAKYAKGTVVIGVNPSRALYDGVLVRHPPEAVADLYAGFARGSLRIEERSMVQAVAGDGQTLVALNEVYVGHERHQSSRYVISFEGESERHSSSGLIVSTGTGASGWARSLYLQRRDPPPLPGPTDPTLAFFVREAWPSVRTGTSLTQGVIEAGGALGLTSEMGDGGVIFGDGIEDDHIDWPYGQVVTLQRAPVALRLAA